MNNKELLEISRREGNLGICDYYGNLMFKFYPNLNIIQRIIFEIFQCFLYIYVAILNEIYFNEYAPWYSKLVYIIKSPIIVIRFWRFDLIITTFFCVITILLSIFFDKSLLVFVPAILWGLRIQLVYEERLRVINEIDYQAKLQIHAGNFDWMWRYSEFNTITYGQMLFKFWKPVNSFYYKHNCILPYEDFQK